MEGNPMNTPTETTFENRVNTGPEAERFASALETSIHDYLIALGADVDLSELLANLVPFAAEEDEVNAVVRLLVQDTSSAAQTARKARTAKDGSDPLLAFGLPEQPKQHQTKTERRNTCDPTTMVTIALVRYLSVKGVDGRLLERMLPDFVNNLSKDDCHELAYILVHDRVGTVDLSRFIAAP